MVIFLYNLYIFIGYNTKQKCIDDIEKWPQMVIFLYNLDIFVWIQHFWGSPFNRFISETIL